METGITDIGFWFILGFVLLLVWSSVWKAIALWKSAKNDSKAWFAVLFILNTAGILEILYIFIFGKKQKINQ